ncbi:MAG: RNA-binding S4 domain-containing protein [Gammaproteobacteria bacterium]|nr:RNA-binding S4 domain-containing protein [Gammaproteobacteria bacterium]
MATALLLYQKGRKVYQQCLQAHRQSATEIVVLRIDKWLYNTRFYKTRGLAAKAVNGGHVKINGARARPASTVKAGDIVELVRGQLPWRLTVRDCPARRGSATEARQCFVEDETVSDVRRQLVNSRKMDRLQMPRTDGRPDKYTRRMLRARRRPG